jgi:hypothetical protein
MIGSLFSDVITGHSWLRRYGTSRKAAGSIPDNIIEFFNWPNPSSRSMDLVSIQPLTEMSTRNIPGDEVWATGT